MSLDRPRKTPGRRRRSSQSDSRRSEKLKNRPPPPDTSETTLLTTKQTLDAATFIVFDIETTGGNPEKNGLTEVCALRYKEGKVEDSFYTMINPGIPIPPIVRRMTGITDNMVRNKPPIESVMPDLVKFIGDSVLVSHNTIGDIKFLRHYSQSVLGRAIDNFYICTHLLAEKLVADSPDKSLKGLAKHLKLKSADFHRAMADAQVTLDLFRVLVTRLQDRSIREVETAIRFQGDYESGMRLGWAVSAEKMRLLPNAPGVFYLLDRHDKVVFLSSAFDLKRDVRRLLKFSQLPRPLLRQVLNTSDMKFEECSSNLSAAILQAKGLAEHPLKIDPVAWHQRTVNAICVFKRGEHFSLEVSTLGQGVVAAYGPVNDRKEAQRLIDEILTQLKPLGVAADNLIPAEYLESVIGYFENALAPVAKRFEKESSSFLSKLIPGKRARLARCKKALKSLQALPEVSGAYFLHKVSGIAVVPKMPTNGANTELYLIANSRLIKTIKISVPWSVYVQKKSRVKALAKKITRFETKYNPFRNEDSLIASGMLWWIFGGANRKEGDFIHLDKLKSLS